MSWRDLSDEEREQIRKRFTKEGFDELLTEIDAVLGENEKVGS